MLVFWLGLAAASAEARALELTPLLCVGGADDLEAAIALSPAELDCSSDRFGKHDRYLRSHANIPREFDTSSQRYVWQTDPARYESMLVLFTFADGSESQVEIIPQAAVRNWFVLTRFSVPVPRSDARLVAVDMVVEKPRTYAVTRDARLVERGEAQAEHYLRSLVYALLCGLLLVPIVYDLLFMRLLKFRFMAWHAAMTAGMLGFVVSNSGIIFLIFPEIPLGLRWQLNTTTLALSAIAAVFFVLDLLEKGKVPQTLSRLLIGFAVVMLAVKIVGVLDFEQFRIRSHLAFLYSMLPVSISLLAVIGTALLKDSRAAIYLMIAFGGLVIAGVLELLTNLNLYHPPFHVDDFVFAAIVMLVLGSSAAVGDRFMVLRVERDRARIRAIKLGRMALTDSLTGLANRRAFDAIERIKEGQALLVADIDHFKAINDEKGHTTGDAVLCNMASLMRENFATNPASTIYRLGGEEFAVVFNCSDEEQMRMTAELLRQHIDRNISEEALGIPHATISIGGAMGNGMSAEEVFARADNAMYEAKRAGRNRSAIADPEGRISVVS